MEKIFVIITILISGIPFVFGEVFIENDQQYIGDDGSLHIVGEIKNNLKAPINQIDIQILLFDENHQIITTKETSSLVNTIMPGMKGPFDLVLINNEPNKIKSYALELEYNITDPKNQVIDITESKLSRDNHNNLMITGTISNKGDFTANTIAVIATLYDKEGKVAAVSRIHPEPDYLRANDSKFFLMALPDKIQTSEINEYELIAESEEYAAVPEYPIGTLIVLAITVSMYVGITRYSGRIITNLISVANPK